MSDTMSFNHPARGFTVNDDYWCWNDINEVYMLKDGKWQYQFNFECDDQEAIVLLKAYIRSKHYGQTND